jgi:hypothetical protein
MAPGPIEGPPGWRGPDMAKSEEWLSRLSSEDIAELGGQHHHHLFQRRLGEVMAGAGFSRFRRATGTPFNLTLEARK